MMRTLCLTAVALTVLSLSACADDDTPTVNKNGSPSPVPTPTAVKEMGHDTVLDGTFVRDYRTAHPNLAKGISDSDLADDAVLVCDLSDDAKGERAQVLAEVSKKFTANGIKPNDDTTEDIMNLAVKTSCPDRLNNLKVVLSGS